MKKNLLYLLIFVLGGVYFTSCNKDDNGPTIIDNPIYGMQIKGTATGDEVLVLDAKQYVEPSSDYSVKAIRDGMMYGIFYLSAGDFAFSEVTADETISYSASSVETVYQNAEVGAATDSIMYNKGSLVSGGTDTYTISEAGLYYVLTDETTSQFWILKINEFEISATGDVATYDSGTAESATFTTSTSVNLSGAFKIRINKAWKFIFEDVPWTNLDAGGVDGDHCRPVISYGGSIDDLAADGDDIVIDNGGQLLNFTFTWTAGEKGIAGIVGTTEDAGELPPAEYPEQMYMIGASIGGWDWAANGIEMIPVHSNAHLFWKIVWIDAGVADAGIKFCEEKSWGKDFGVDATAGATDGVYAKGTDNVPDIAESGYYMVVVNLADGTIEINAPSVNGIGSVFADDSWAGGVEFTVDNTAKTITSPVFSADGELRMYVKANTLTTEDGNAIDWWQAEFIVLSGVIEYRGTGNDQERANVTAGQKVILDFINGTGSIE